MGGDSMQMSRRQAIGTLLAGAALPAAAAAMPAPGDTTAAAPQQPRLALVSRHLQWTSADHGLEVAQAAGFGSIIWTVRRGAHVDPADVQRELPRIVARTRAAGLDVPMIITGIGDAGADSVEPILATMAGLGIRLYRAGAPRYRYDAPLQPQYDDFRRRIAALAKLNEKHGVTAAFHTHAYADSIGGSAWDLWMLMNDQDPRHVGLNYDIGHVMAKGGAGWRESIRAVGPYLHSVSIKDFRWEKLPQVPAGQWPWRTRLVPPGEGMVNFGDFFRYLQGIGFAGPLETYYEYMVRRPGLAAPFDMLGTDVGKWQLTIPEADFIGLLRRDVGFYNQVWRAAATTPPPPPFSVKAPE
jgi:sugar phosphate isomerase/epimerase